MLVTLGNFMAFALYSIPSLSSGPAPTAYIPDTLTYLLPENFTSNIHDTFLNSTSTSDTRVNWLLASAVNSVVTCYDTSQVSFCGRDLVAEVLLDWPKSGAFYEAGIYIPSVNEVWFTSNYAQYVHIMSGRGIYYHPNVKKNWTAIPPRAW